MMAKTYFSDAPFATNAKQRITLQDTKNWLRRMKRKVMKPVEKYADKRMKQAVRNGWE